MHFDELWVGDYRIYAGALESPIGDGYIAAMVVHVHGHSGVAPREVLRDESLACGHRWESADAALAYALNKAQHMVDASASEAMAGCAPAGSRGVAGAGRPRDGGSALSDSPAVRNCRDARSPCDCRSDAGARRRADTRRSSQRPAR